MRPICDRSATDLRPISDAKDCVPPVAKCALRLCVATGTRDLPWAARRDASPYRVPYVRFARVWLIGRRKRERLRRINRACADSGQGARQSGCERERARTAGCARRRRNGGVWRREVFRPSQTPRCGGWIAQTKADESRGPRAERRRKPQGADVPTVADNAPAQPSGLDAEA